MALTANREVNRYVDQALRSHAVAGSVRVFKGGFVSLNSSGYARPLTAGDRLLGLAYEEKDNTSGANGDGSVRVFTMGDFEHALAGAAVADVGRPVFASDDGTLSFVGAGNTYVGIARDVPAAGTVVLRLDSDSRALKTMRYAVSDLAAGADLSDTAVHAFAQESWVVGARIVNGATAAVGIDNANTCTVTVKRNGLTVATKVYNATTTSPVANASDSLGTISNPYAAAAERLTVSVMNGVTANPGPFTIEVDYA